MADITILNHGVRHDGSERYIYFVPVQISDPENDVIAVNVNYDTDTKSSETSAKIITSKVGESSNRSYLIEDNGQASITLISNNEAPNVIKNGRILEFLLSGGSGISTNFQIGDVVYLKSTWTSTNVTDGVDPIKTSVYKYNSAAYIIEESTTSSLILSLHDSFPDSFLDNLETTSIEWTVIKPIYNWDAVETYKANLSASDIVDGNMYFEMFIEGKNDSSIAYNGAIILSSEIMAVNTNITPDEKIFEFTESGYLYGNNLSIQRSIVKEGYLTPSLLVKFEGRDMKRSHRIRVTSNNNQSATGLSNYGAYNYYDDNIIRLAESVVSKAIGDVYESIIGLDIMRGIIEKETVDYDRVEKYIDEALLNQNLSNTFDNIFVLNDVNIGDNLSIYSTGNNINFKTKDGSFGISVLSDNSYVNNTILFDNSSLISFVDDVECNNSFKIRYDSSSNGVTRRKTLVDSQSGFFKIILDNNTTNTNAGNDINSLFNVSCNNSVMLSAFMKNNVDIVSLGYCSPHQINNLTTFNGFISESFTNVVVSQEKQLVGLASQGNLFMYAQEKVQMHSNKTIDITTTGELNITADKVNYNARNLGFNANNLTIDNLSLNKVDTSSLSTSFCKVNDIDIVRIMHIFNNRFKMRMNDPNDGITDHDVVVTLVKDGDDYKFAFEKVEN